MNETAKILILGGTRFIGRTVLNLFIAKGFKNVSIFHRGVHEIPSPPYIKHIHGNRNSYSDMKSLMKEKYDFIFDISGEHFEEVKLAVEIAKNNCYKYIFCSSTSVYKYHPGLNSIKEDSETLSSSTNPYIRDKIESEKLIIDRLKNYIIIRPSKVYGIYNYINREKWFYEKILKNELIELNNNPLIHFTYVEDLANAFVCLVSINIENAIFNVSGLQYCRLEEFIKTIYSIEKKKPSIKMTSNLSLNYPYCNANDAIIDSSKFESATLWKPLFSIKTGLSLTMKHYYG